MIPNAQDAYLKKNAIKTAWNQILHGLNGLHHYMFDEENLINTLKLSPFKNVELRF